MSYKIIRGFFGIKPGSEVLIKVSKWGIGDRAREERVATSILGNRELLNLNSALEWLYAIKPKGQGKVGMECEGRFSFVTE
ncbi:MAG: hypothetical protein J7J65_01800 [Candidatus Korarchaeota archaeon]|nr:hypothetical protein [Candidatus Korarchaeota archaeon]